MKIARLLLLFFLFIPASAWLGGYTYRRNATGAETQYIVAINGTSGSDIDGDATTEWIYGQFGDLYYNSGSDTALSSDGTTQIFKAQTEPVVDISGSPLSNLKYFYPLDRSETAAWDMSGYDNNGTLEGSPTQGATGKLGKGYSFTGGSNVDTVIAPNYVGPASWTIATWLKADDVTNVRFIATYANWGADGNGCFMLRFASSAIYLYVYKGGSWQNLNTDNLVTGTWYHVVAKKSGDDFTIYIDGAQNVTSNLAGTWGTLTSGAQFEIGSNQNANDYSFDGVMDHFMFFNTSLSADEILQIYNGTSYSVLGAEESSSATIFLSASPEYPYVNGTVTSNATWDASYNYTQFWWSFGDGNETYKYDFTGSRNYSTMDHIYNTSGTYTINVTAYEEGSGVNATNDVSVTVYDRISATNITITDYLPFLFWNGTHVFGINSTGGTPNLNDSWAITLPNSSIFYYVNESPLSFSPPMAGTYDIDLTVCDLEDSTCVSDSDSYRPWNVTGGVFLVEGFNVSESCLSELFLGDSVTLSSGDQSLNWAMDGWTSVGTSAAPAFSSSYAYWNDDNYYHFNMSLNTSWGAYTSYGWFTVSAATYTLRAGACEASEAGYCWVWGELYDEATFAEISDATTDWDFYSVTSDYYGHAQEESVNTTAADLNITWCSNATPLLDHMLVDAMLTYSLENYTTRIYAWDNATFDFSGTCSYANGHRYKFYTVSNATTSSVTFTVTQGGEALEDALLQIQAFHSSTWVTVASQLTDSSGQAQFDIHLCPTYYKFVVQKSGAILYSDKDCAETTSYTIEVGEELDEFFSVWYDISTSCSYDETDEYVACTISDPTGLTVVSTLNVTTALDYSETAVCEVSEASGTTTLVCSVAGEPAGDYAWLLTITTSSGSYKVNTGGFTIYGDIMELEDKGVVAFATILVLLLATRLPPEATILLSVGGFLAIRMMGLITTSYMAVGWVLALGVVGIMRVVKGG